MAAFPCGGDQDCRCALNRAFVFADSAADAQLVHDVRLPGAHLFTFAVLNRYLTEFNSLVRCRAVFFADDARRAGGIGQATIFVEMGQAHHECLFGWAIQTADGPGGAHLAAEGAVVLAVTDSADQPWGEYSFKPGFQPGGVEGIANADLHAFTASDTEGKKVGFRQGAGRPDQEGVGVSGERTGRQGEWHQGAGCQRGHHGPSG